MTIRPLTPGDLPAALHLCRLSGWNQLAEDWTPFLPIAWLAEHEGSAAGTVALLPYGASFTWLSMMLVDPRLRRSGIGSRLLAAALDAASGRACIRLDATPAGEPLYRRFGFVPEYPLARATIAAGPRAPLPSRAIAMTPSHLASVFDLDPQIFGADRSSLLSAFFHRAPQSAAVLYEGATLRGYSFGRPGYRYHQIGPIVAESAAVAQELATYCLSSAPGPLAIDIPRHSPEWIEWLESIAFKIERPFLRMRRGDNAFPGIPEQQFAIAGPEFG